MIPAARQSVAPERAAAEVAPGRGHMVVRGHDAPVLGGEVDIVLGTTPLGVVVATDPPRPFVGDDPRFHPRCRLPLAAFIRRSSADRFVVEDQDGPDDEDCVLHRAASMRVLGILDDCATVRTAWDELEPALDDPRVFSGLHWVRGRDVYRVLAGKTHQALSNLPFPHAHMTAQALRGHEPGPVPTARFRTALEEVLEVMLRGECRGVLLGGPAGVGKSSLVQCLVRRIVEGLVPARLRRTSVIQVDPSVLDFRHPEWKARRAALEALPDLDVIVVVDEAHRLLQGSHNFQSEPLDELKLLVTEHGLRVILVTNAEHRLLGKDDALDRRITPVLLAGADPREVLEEILPAKAEHGRLRTGIATEPRGLVQALAYSELHGGHAQPHGAVALLDRAVARAELRGLDAVTGDLVADVGLSLLGRDATLRNDPESWRREIGRRVVGHERAVARIVASLLAHERRRTNPRVFEGLEQGARREARADLGAFAMVLAGPSGVGKTSMARAIHRLRSGPSGGEMLHISGASFPRPEYLSQLVGTTAGYVGYGQGGELVTALKRNPRLVVEIAEPELGCPALMHRVVLPMLDGEIVGNEGDRISTRGVCIFLTTNAGSVDRTPPVGFQPWGDERSVRDHEQRLDELRRVLPPRVLSRLGEERVVLLDPLSTAELREVARRLLGALEEREGVTLHVEARVLDALVEGCDGLDTLGVRALVRRVEELVEVPLMDLALTTPDLREALVLIESEGEVRVRAAETVSGKDESDETSR